MKRVWEGWGRGKSGFEAEKCELTFRIVVDAQGLGLEGFVFELVCLSRQEMELFGQRL